VRAAAELVALDRFYRKGFRAKSDYTRSIEHAAYSKDAPQFYESLGYERNGWRFVKQLPLGD
jgi:hypothetical protein